MAEHDDAQNSNEKKTGPAAVSDGDLPAVDAPSVSPATIDEEPPADCGSPIAPPVEPFSPMIRRLLGPAGLAAATIIGAVLGALASTHFSAPRVDTAALAERHTTQQSIARLSHELTTLKGELATANKSARAQTAQLTKLNEALTRKLARESAAVTGSIVAPQTTVAAKTEAQAAAATQAAPATAAAAAIAPASAQTATPLPPPRPAEIAAREEPQTPIVQGWWVIGARHGLVYVRSGHDVFGVAPGARLPGVGLVEDVRRQDGDWIVVTRRGLIVAERERRYFDRY